MKYIITESQYKLISELERHWMDRDYSEEYERVRSRIVPYFKNLFVNGSENDFRISVFDSEGVKLMVYIKPSGELYYDKELDNTYENFLPHPFWLRHGKYILADVFESLNPGYEVKRVQSAHIS